MLLMMPANTTVAVSRERGTAPTRARSATDMSPLCSVTPIPITTTITRPSGGNAAKFATACVRIRLSPSADSRFTAVIVSPVPGWTADTFMDAAIHDTAITASASMMNSVMGSGSLLPTRSTMSSARSANPRFTCVGWFGAVK